MLKYEQVMAAVVLDIENGRLLPKEQLPAVKHFCQKFSVSEVTVKRALSELKRKKRLALVRRKGFFVLE